MAKRHDARAHWEAFLTGELPGVDRSRRILSHIPSTPRCKLCAAPYGLPGGAVMRLLGGGPSPLNRRLCRWCVPKLLAEEPGGAEVELTILFADVRGSTTLAEGMAPGAYSALLARFYGTAARVVDRWNGIVDKFVGDAVVALFIPGFAGPDHAAGAVGAARDLLAESPAELPLGVGVHTGVSFVGVVGEGDAIDFTALGDAVNATARLSALAAPGELLVSAATAEAAELDTSGCEHRCLELRGRSETLDVWRVGSRS